MAALPVLGTVNSGEYFDDDRALIVKTAVIDDATSGNNTIVVAVTGKKIRVLSLFIVVSTANTVRFESGAGTAALTGAMEMAANSSLVLPENRFGWFETAAGALLNMELSGATTVDGAIRYVEID